MFDAHTPFPPVPPTGAGEPTPLHVAFVLDASGSMEPLAGAVIEGFDDFLRGLRADDRGETRLSLTLFDTTFEHRHVAAPLERVGSLRRGGYRPDGMTALFDAVAHTVLDTDRRLAAEGKADEKVMLVVMTDGHENASTDYDAAAITHLIARYDERPNWTFVYLGAGHATLADACAAAEGMAFKGTNAMRWEAEESSVRRSMSSLGRAAVARKHATAMKTDALFAEAGQTEAEYGSGEEGRRVGRQGPRA